MAYSRKELVQKAHESGFVDASERLIAEWVRLGLLDTAKRVTRRDGRKGAHYVWHENQLNLFLLLLTKRKDVNRISSLVVIPVAIWMYWGDEWITLKQVRRALSTSLDLFGSPHSWERANSEARQVVKKLLGPRVPKDKVNLLIDTLTQGLYHKKLDRDLLASVLTDIAKHDSQLKHWGPFGFDIDAILDLFLATLTAVNCRGSISDRDFIDARYLQRKMVLFCSMEYPHLSKLTTFGEQFEKITFDSLVTRSCRDLLFQLGMLIIHRENGDYLNIPRNLEWRPPRMALLNQS